MAYYYQGDNLDISKVDDRVTVYYVEDGHQHEITLTEGSQADLTVLMSLLESVMAKTYAQEQQPPELDYKALEFGC